MPPKRKHSKPSRQGTRSEHRAVASKAPIGIQVILYAVVALLFAAGQYLIHLKKPVWGTVLSTAGFLLLLALFFGWLDRIGSILKLPRFPSPAPRPAAPVTVHVASRSVPVPAGLVLRMDGPHHLPPEDPGPVPGR
jgi:hypothetical protein